MTNPMPGQCPACAGPLHVARLACDACGTAIEGRFSLGRLARLQREQLQFVEVFLECRGKIKDVEARLGISYPTVISRLEQVVVALGPPVQATDASGNNGASEETDAILEALARGEITAKEAAQRIRARKKETKR